MDARTLAALELDSVKRLIEAHLRTPLGRRALEALAPSPDPDVVANRRGLAEEAMRHLREAGRPGPSGLDDPAEAIERLRPEGAILEALEISRLVAVMQAGDAARIRMAPLAARFPRLWDVAGALPDATGVARAIAGRIAPDGRLEDSASPDLGRMRRRVTALEDRLQVSLHEILDRARDQGWLQDNYITVRSGRFVLPLRAESRGSMAGVVHGASSTGATVFVEPLETLELNNDLVTAREAELAETRKILAQWSALLRSRIDDIEIHCRALGQLDLLSAAAAYGVAAGASVPSEPKGAERIRLVHAKHPTLEASLQARGEAAVALDVEMPATGGALVLSGPNAGGKTVALKTIGTLALMHQAGLPVPAVEAELPTFRQVLADIGDHQSILESLSTFSARVARVAEISGALRTPALVLIDEVGAGTDPEEAGALAVAIVDHFKSRGAAVVATTHHEALKAYASVTRGAENASMEMDPITLRPTYRLLAGAAGRSSGIDVAERVGLPPEVVANARSRLATGHREVGALEARLQELTQEKERELEGLHRQQESARQEREAEREAARRRVGALEKLWNEAGERALAAFEKAREELLAQIKDRAVQLQLRAESRRQDRSLREQLMRLPGQSSGDERPLSSAAGGLRPGSRARVAAGAGVGEVVIVASVDDRGRAEVLVRGKRLTLRTDDLIPVEEHAGPAAPRGPRPPEGIRLERAGRPEAATELNLIGYTVEDALDRLDRFLDDAYLAGHGRVRIVHGHGTGRLRAAIRKMLERHVHVASQEQAEERHGGAGATIAVLKA